MRWTSKSMHARHSKFHVRPNQDMAAPLNCHDWCHVCIAHLIYYCFSQWKQRRYIWPNITTSMLWIWRRIGFKESDRIWSPKSSSLTDVPSSVKIILKLMCADYMNERQCYVVHWSISVSSLLDVISSRSIYLMKWEWEDSNWFENSIWPYLLNLYWHYMLSLDIFACVWWFFCGSWIAQ